MKSIITALAIIVSIFQTTNANVVRVEECKLNCNGISYYDIDGNIMSEFSDAESGDSVVLFINDNGTETMLDDKIEYSIVIDSEN